MKNKKYKVTKPQVDKDIKKKAERDPFFDVVAKVYGIPVNGIDAIGTQPYINKDGRLYLLNELKTGKSALRSMKVEFIKMSTTIVDPSIVKKILLFKDDLEIEAIGEASQDNVENSSVKKTLNMVAETRALNRAIWNAIGADAMKRAETNLKTLKISDIDRARILEAGRISYEEMEKPNDNGKTPVKAVSMYDATAKRIEEISKNKEKLLGALSKVDSLPLKTEEKILISQRINGCLQDL